jgi:UDP-N-acetylmuramoyl-tripeptide--D-alanyl-D-alanine ligase
VRPLTAGWIAEAVGGTLVNLSENTVVIDVVKDSAEVSPGSMFAALSGEHVDGHDFAASAVASGSVAVLAAHPVRDAADASLPSIVVDDVPTALGRLAAAYRSSLEGCTVIAITGSSGKTSTKDLIGGVLSSIGTTVSAPGSFNTEIGVPLTILSADDSTEYLVVEMGMRGLGHIAYLADMAKPDIGVVLNVGTAHLGMLGSQDQIAAAKEELITALDPAGVAILNVDDDRVALMADRSRARVLSFGESADAAVGATNVHLDDQARARFTLVDRRAEGGPDHEVLLRVRGRHFVSNALAAAAVGLAVGAQLDVVAKALGDATVSSRWRMEVSETESGVMVINDAYNANPDSMRAAISVLAATYCAGERWLVLGEMRELGEESILRHEEIGRTVVDLGIDRLVCVGEGTSPAALAALSSGASPDSVFRVSDVDEALALVSTTVRSGDVVLVKASRSIGLERLAIGLSQGVTT